MQLIKLNMAITVQEGGGFFSFQTWKVLDETKDVWVNPIKIGTVEIKDDYNKPVTYITTEQRSFYVIETPQEINRLIN